MNSICNPFNPYPPSGGAPLVYDVCECNLMFCSRCSLTPSGLACHPFETGTSRRQKSCRVMATAPKKNSHRVHREAQHAELRLQMIQRLMLGSSFNRVSSEHTCAMAPPRSECHHQVYSRNEGRCAYPLGNSEEPRGSEVRLYA